MFGWLTRLFRRNTKKESAAEDQSGKDDGSKNAQDEDKQYRARLAVYDNLRSPPRIIKICEREPVVLIENTAQKTHQIIENKGGSIPFLTIKEIVENLIHANFSDVVVTIMPSGKTIRISDRGPGIDNKKLALQPGFSTADEKLKKLIRGVGSGLPVARETISFVGGQLIISDNLKKGTVITLTTEDDVDTGLEGEKSAESQITAASSGEKNGPDKNTGEWEGVNPEKKEEEKQELEEILSRRQKKVLLLLAEIEKIGPSRVAEELDISLSTAYRDLKLLEDYDLVWADPNGKRQLSEHGLEFISKLFE